MHVFLFFHMFPRLMLGLVVYSSRPNSTTLSQIQHIKSARTKIQKQDLRKQRGITDVENASLPNQSTLVCISFSIF